MFKYWKKGVNARRILKTNKQLSAFRTFKDIIHISDVDMKTENNDYFGE